MLYETSSNQPVVEKFIDSLQVVTRAKLVRQLTLLEEYGVNLGMPHAKSMGEGLFELRVRGKTEIRVFYIFSAGKNVYLLHGFIKKQQTTPRKELVLARKRQKEIQNIA